MAKIEETVLTQAIKDCMEEDLPILDRFIKEEIEPLLKVGSPEALLEKKYEQWTPEDFQTAAAIFPQEKIEDFIAKKEINEMYTEESTEV